MLLFLGLKIKPCFYAGFRTETSLKNFRYYVFVKYFGKGFQ